MKKLFSLVKQANIKNYFANLISGPEVNELIQTNHNMLGLGAPTQYDDQGYNKMDFSSNIVNRMANIAPGSEITVQDGFDLLKVMAKYQGRQISNFKDLYLNFKRVADSAAQKDNYSHDFMKPKILGSIGNFFTIQLPQLKNIDDVKNSLFEKVSKLDSNVKNLLGLNNIFKHDSRFGPNSFIIKKNYLNQLLESLQENGYNTTGISPIEESPESDLSYEKKAILQTRNSFGNIGVRLVGSLGKELKGYDEQYKELSAKVISDVAKFWHGDPAKTWQILSFTQADNFQHVWINKSVIGPVMESLSKHGFKVEDKLGVQKELEENKKIDEQVKSEKDLASEIPEEQLKISKKVLFSIGTQSLIELKLDETVINALIQKNRTNLDKVTKLTEMKQNIRDEIYETAIKVLFPINSAVADKSKGQLTSEDKIQKKVTDTKSFDKAISVANKKIADLQAKKVQIANKLKSFEQAIKHITNQTAAAAIRKSIQLELKNMSKIQNDIKKHKQQIQQSEQNVKNLQALPTRNQNGSRRTGSISYRFSLTGTIDSFSSLRQILAAEKYEGSDALANLIKQLQASGRMEQSDSIINGVPDGFLVKNDEGKTVFDKQKFEQALTSIDAKFKKTEIIDGKEVTVGGLLPLQKDGIKFLYSTKSAINSDEVGTGKCQAPETIINTSESVFEMQQFYNKFAINQKYENQNENWADLKKQIFIHSVDQNGKIVKKKISRLFRQKYNGQMISYKTDNGKSTLATPAHRFLKHTGQWKSNIECGEYICSSSNLFRLTQVDETNIKPGLQYLIAWQIAEGCQNKKRATVRISQENISILSKLHSQYKSYGFSHSGSISKYKNKCSTLAINSKEYKQYLQSIGYVWGRKSKEKQVPSFIFKLSSEKQKTFIRAMFDAEGTVNKASRGISMTSASKKLIKQMSFLLQQFNIPCSFKSKLKCATNGTKIKRQYYELTIISSGLDRYMSEIGFEYKYKTDIYNSHKSTHNYNKEGKPAYLYLQKFFKENQIPTSIKHSYGLSGKDISGQIWMSSDRIKNTVLMMSRLLSGELINQYSDKQKKNLSKFHQKQFQASKQKMLNIKHKDINQVINNLNILSKNDLMYEKIISAEKIDYDGYIYDLQIEDTHNYVAQNLICHNTVQLIAAALLRQKQLGGKVVFFTLASVQPQFKRQVSRFTEIPVDEISDDPQSLKSWNVFRYDQISKGRNALINTRLLSSLSDLTVLALDEVHALKSPDAKATQSMNLITKKAKFVWGASATAAANTPMDLYSQLRIIKHPIGLMPFEMFEKEFDIPFHEAQDQAFRELVGTPEYEQADANTRKELEKNKALQKQILKTIKLKHIMSQAKIMIARSKKQAREDMPDLNIVKHDVKFEQSNEELSMIAADKMLEKLVNLNLIDLKDPQRNQQLQSDFVKLAYTDKKKAVRLVQEVQKTSRIALAKQKFMYAPALQKIREVVALKKIPTTISRALEISNNTIKNEKGEEKHRKVLIFTAFTQAADEINKRLNSSYKNRRTGGFYQVSKIITGDNAKMRQEIVEDFKNHESETVFLVMTLKAGGTGIDFPNVTSDVIENDFEWTPSTSQQSRGRAYRINSKQNVRIHSILADGPDKGIREKVDLKIAIAEVINKNTYDIIRELEEGKQLNDSGVNIRMKTLVENTAKLMAIQSQAKKSQVSLYEGSESHNQAEQDANDDISGADNSAYSVAKDAMKNTVQIFKEKIEMTGFKDTFRQVEEILGLNKKSAMSYYNNLIKLALNKSSTFKIAQEDVGEKINPEEVIQNSPKSLQKFQKKKKK